MDSDSLSQFPDDKVWESRCLWIWILKGWRPFLTGTIVTCYFGFLEGLSDIKKTIFYTQTLFFYVFGTVWYHVLLLKSLTVVFEQQGEELECDFGTEQRYEATWMNSSVVKCSGITVRSLELYLIAALIIIKRDCIIASSCFCCSYFKSLFFEFTLLVR